MYSGGGALRSVPGRRRSINRGDWPDEKLDAVVTADWTAVPSSKRELIVLGVEMGWEFSWYWSDGAAYRSDIYVG